jgi:hypothetical protein
MFIQVLVLCEVYPIARPVAKHDFVIYDAEWCVQTNIKVNLVEVVWWVGCVAAVQWG